MNDDALYPATTIENGLVVVRFPIPPEEHLLRMAYQLEVGKGTPMFVIRIELPRGFVDLMLQNKGNGHPWKNMRTDSADPATQEAQNE